MSEHPLPAVSRLASPLSNLRERLVQARYQHEWSQQELADLLGTTPLNISRWEHGLTSPNPYFRHKLCALFGLDEIELGLRSDPALIASPARLGHQEGTATRFPLYDPFLPLPAAVPLVGRAALLAELKSQLSSTRAIALSALHGLPGVGKTALALELAYDAEVREHYPDGLLWAALGPRPHLLNLLSHWGRLLGINDDEAVRLSTQEAWARTLRATIGSRRLLFVLDDVWKLEEALACQVGGPQCAYVLTTRLPQLAQSFALSAAHTVETLGEEEGLELLRQLAPWAVEQAHEQLRALVRAVGGLPLALSLVGSTLRQQTHNRQPRRLQAALERLQNGLVRLQLAQSGVPGQRSLEIVLKSSAEQLTAEARQAWAALSVLPARPHSFSETAALAVSGQEVERLDELSDAGMLEAVGTGRYTFHQVLADYGRAQLSEQEYQRTLGWLIGYSLRYAEEYREHYTALEEETSVLTAGLEACEEHSEQEAQLRLILALAPFWRARGDYAQAERWLTRAGEEARALGRKLEEAQVWLLQGKVDIGRGDYEQAQHSYEQALALARGVDELAQVCASLSGIGRAAYKRGKYDEAEHFLLEGLALARQQGLLQQQAELLWTLGGVLGELGKLEEERACLQEALQLAQQIGEYELTSSLFNDLGNLYHILGEIAQAARCYQDALAVARQRGYRSMEGILLANLGMITRAQGDYRQAEQYLQEGLSLARQLDNPMNKCAALLNLGEIVPLVQGEYARAEQYLQEGLSLARQFGIPTYMCITLMYLGEVALARGDYKQAEQQLQEGLSLARQFGIPTYICITLMYLGEVALARGDYKQAEQQLQEGLSLSGHVGFFIYRGETLNTLGEVALARGDYEQAEQHLQEGLSLARQFGVPEYLTKILTNLGALARVRGDHMQAEQHLQEGLQLLRRLQLRPLLCRMLYQWGMLALQRGQLEEAAASFEEILATAPEEARLEPALARYGLAQVAVAQGKIIEARQLGEQALSTLETMGHREAIQVRRWLEGLEQDA